MKLEMYKGFSDDEGMADSMQSILNEMVQKISEARDKMIFDRICERVKTDEPIDLTKEEQRMFPRLKQVFDSSDQSEHWYWNDGSEKGLHIISFYQDNNFNMDDLGTYSIKFNVR